jgi:hypothetical protein
MSAALVTVNLPTFPERPAVIIRFIGANRKRGRRGRRAPPRPRACPEATVSGWRLITDLRPWLVRVRDACTPGVAIATGAGPRQRVRAGPRWIGTVFG